MKSKFELVDQGFVLVRAPLLPLQTFYDWHAADDKESFVRSLYKQSMLCDALYIASPSLYDRFLEYFGENESQSDEASASTVSGAISSESTAPNPTTTPPKRGSVAEKEKLVLALCKYLSRAAYRCTPFGLFATVTTGDIAESTQFTSLSDSPIRANIRYDASFQGNIIAWLLSDKSLREKLAYRVNSSLSTGPKKYFYVEAIDTELYKTYQFSQVEREAHLDALVSLAATSVSFQSLHSCISDNTRASREEVDDYLHQLIDSQILISDIEIRITGDDSFTSLFRQLELLGEHHRIGMLKDAIDALNRSPISAFGEKASQLEAVYNEVSTARIVKVNRKLVFQTDAVREAPVALSKSLAEKIARVTQLLCQLCGKRSTVMDEFKRSFYERYEEKEVPLDLVFNDELGIPFPKLGKPISDLIEGVDFPQWVGSAKQQIAWGGYESLLFQKFSEALERGSVEIQLSESEINQVYRHNSDVPVFQDGVFTQATLFSKDAGGSSNPDDGIGIYIQTLGGRSGVETCGRFCQVDETLHEKVRGILKEQEQREPHKIYAEVVHLPQDRIINIVARPVLREYEIPYLGGSSAETDKQIPISDLRLSLKNNRFCLRSARLGKEIVPRLSSSHNYASNNLSIYQFLCFLQYEDQPLAFGGVVWPANFQSVKFLPRITVDGVIVALATWRLLPADIGELRSMLESGDVDLAGWRAKWKLPRFVTMDVFDNTLPIDLDNLLSIRMFLDEVEARRVTELRESVALSESAARQNSAIGPLNLEIMMPLKVVDPRAQTNVPAAVPYIAPEANDRPSYSLKEPHLYLPGSEWIYFKLYCGISQADELVRNYIAPAMREFASRGLIEKWFFVRYSDPHHHVRIRALRTPGQRNSDAPDFFSEISKKALDDGLCWKVIVDSYDREVDRYGGLETIALCESIFHVDAELIADLFSSTEETIPASERWIFCVQYVDSLLNAFELTKDGRKKIIQSMADSFKREFSFGARQKVQLGMKYRSYRPLLDKLIFGRDKTPDARRGWQDILLRYSDRLTKFAREIRAIAEKSGDEHLVGRIIPSIVHMHCNRMFTVSQRAHETVFYDFLVRIEESKAATRGK